jgi:hypothetical protein
MGRDRLRFELRVALHGQEPGMARQLDDFDQLAVWTCTRDLHAVRAELLAIGVVELIAVPMAFVHFELAVGLVSKAAFGQLAGVFSEPHGAAEVCHLILAIEQADHGMSAIAFHLGAVGVFQASDVAGKLDDRALQTQADAEERNLAFARVTDSRA